MSGDWFFRIPALRVAEARAQSYTWVLRIRLDHPRFDACHYADVAFVFDTLQSEGADWLLGSQPPQSLADTMHSAWVAFTCTANPGWDRYTTQNRETMIFNTHSAVARDRTTTSADYGTGYANRATPPPRLGKRLAVTEISHRRARQRDSSWSSRPNRAASSRLRQNAARPVANPIREQPFCPRPSGLTSWEGGAGPGPENALAAWFAPPYPLTVAVRRYARLAMCNGAVCACGDLGIEPERSDQPGRGVERASKQTALH